MLAMTATEPESGTFVEVWEYNGKPFARTLSYDSGDLLEYFEATDDWREPDFFLAGDQQCRRYIVKVCE